MELNSFQQDVGKLTDSWSNKQIDSIMLLLTEEMGELARAIRKSDTRRWGHEKEPVGSTEDIAGEVGDVLFLLARVSLITGIEMDRAAAMVLEKIRLRMAQSC